MVASCVPPTGDLAHNLGMCLHWESNWQPFCSQAGAQSTEPQAARAKNKILVSKELAWVSLLSRGRVICEGGARSLFTGPERQGKLSRGEPHRDPTFPLRECRVCAWTCQDRPWPNAPNPSLLPELSPPESQAMFPLVTLISLALTCPHP